MKFLILPVAIMLLPLLAFAEDNAPDIVLQKACYSTASIRLDISLACNPKLPQDMYMLCKATNISKKEIAYSERYDGSGFSFSCADIHSKSIRQQNKHFSIDGRVIGRSLAPGKSVERKVVLKDLVDTTSGFPASVTVQWEVGLVAPQLVTDIGAPSASLSLSKILDQLELKTRTLTDSPLSAPSPPPQN